MSIYGIETKDLLKNNKKTFFGKYRGIVTLVDDPKQQGRIKARVPKVLGIYDSDWALPCVPFAGKGYGLQMLPNPGDGVWIEFEGGDPMKPIWTGFWWKPAELPVGSGVNYTNKKRFIWTPGGVYIAMDDTQGSEKLTLHHPSGSEITMTSDGKVTIKATLEVIVDSPSVSLAGGGAGIARIGDTVSVDPETGVGTITGGSTKVKSG